MIWIVLALMAVVVAPYAAEGLRRPITDADRAGREGRTAALSLGPTYYRWRGNPRGPVVVCIHGLTTPSEVFEPIATGIARLGYQVLTYDLYGRGLSARPRVEHDRAFYLRQLSELLDHLGIEGDVTLVGYSMGGSIATAFTAEHPERVRRLILLASAGLGHTPGRLAEFLRRTPVLGDWLMLTLGGLWLARAFRAEASGAPLAVPDLPAVQVAQTRTRGYLPAVLSSQRGILAEDMAPEHADIAAWDIPVLAIWGQDDRVIPLAAMGRLAEINRAAMQEMVPGAGHALPVTHPRECIATIAEFLRRS